jgi:hypothetical protein
MEGYWNLAEASAEVLRGGWLHTGDAGHLDADGYVYISDRLPSAAPDNGPVVEGRRLGGTPAHRSGSSAGAAARLISPATSGHSTPSVRH